MRHHGPDVAYFVQTSPYLQLAKPRAAERFLKRQVEAAEECASTLRAYPDVHIEPLSFAYTCLRSLGALDRAFFEALLGDHTWRGVVWGAWLSLLDPREEHREALRAAGPRWPKNAWIVACALAALDGRAAETESAEVMALAARLRRSLHGVRRPVVPLRREPTEEERARMERERESIRLTYAARGAEAALGALPGTLVGLYAQDYVRWVRSRGG